AATAAMVLRQVADGFALLARDWPASHRERLPLPTLPLVDHMIRMAGLDDWAADRGHPIGAQDTSESAVELLDEQREAIGRLPEVGGVAEVFAGAVWRYEILELLRASPSGRLALGRDGLAKESPWWIWHARQRAAFTMQQTPDAAGLSLAMMLIAE